MISKHTAEAVVEGLRNWANRYCLPNKAIDDLLGLLCCTAGNKSFEDSIRLVRKLWEERT